MDREGTLSRAPRMRAFVAMVTAVTLAVVGLTLATPQTAEAAVVQWGTNGGNSPNYQANVNGDFLMAGNGVLACTGTTGLTLTNGTCNDLHAAANANPNNANDNFLMTDTNGVAGFTTNSSSATMNIPAGATVVKAFLNWSANTGVFTGESRTLCSTYSIGRGTATLPAGSATGYTSRAVQLKVGGGAITSVAPQSMLADPTSQATARYYSASSDVTAAFAGVTTGSDITISAGNIWAPTGAGCYAGWSITVVYDYGTFIPDNPASVPHNVIYYEGHVRQGAADPDLTVAFNGFTAVAPGTRAGFTLYEGDRNITADTASYSRGGSASYTAIANPAGATNNIGIGRALNSVRYAGQAGTAFTNQSVDVAVVPLTNVIAGDSTVNLRLGTSGDSFLLSNAVLSVPTAGLQVDKSYNGTADTQARTSAELATFTIRLTNTGAGTLRNIVVEDDQVDCSRSLTGITLAPLQSTTFTCTATAPSTTGFVSTASATAYTVVGNYLAQDSDSTTVLLSAIALVKTSALAPGATGRAGDVLTYTFTVTNTGQSTLTGVTISDPLVGLSQPVFSSWPGPAGTLTPGQSATATATYTLKQSDVDAGSIVNAATARGTDSDGGLQPIGNANHVTPIAAAASIVVGKTGALASGATGRVGDRINYTFTFRNTGNVTLANASLVDPLPGLSPPVITWPTATAGLLPAGQTATATAFYTITQADVDAGFVRNTATVTARTPSGATATGTSPQVQVATVASAPGLTTTKSGAITSGTGGVGSTITYTFTARNSGNTTLTAVSIADPLPGLSALAYTWPGTAGRLAPGQSATATATYTITQADVNAGSVKNTAVGSATTPAGATLTVPSSQSTVPTVAAAPAVALTKSGTLAPGSTGRAGDVVTYSFSLTNSGNVTLTNAAITDPLAGLSALTYTWPGPAGVLQPGQAVTATATYTLKQSDVDAGSVANTVTATAKPPTGADVTQTRSATVPIAPTRTLTVLKSGAITAGTGAVGSTVTYQFSATNAGNVTLTQVAIADPLPGLSSITYTWPGTAGTLAPGQTVQATATYVIRQSDLDAGGVTNTATASGRAPGGTVVTGTSQTTRVVTVPAAPASTTTKTASVSGASGVGDVITYTVRTTNTGNVTLTGVAITDALAGLSAFTYTWPGTAGRLAPGQSVTAVATYTIKQADVDAGSVSNTASSTAAFGATPVPSTSGPVVTPTVAATPSIVTTKSGSLQSGASGVAGDTIVWTITLRNSGNVSLTGVSVADSLPGITAPSYGTWPSGTAGVLRPGQTVTATATSVISQADVNSGAVSNTATGSGQPPTGAAVASTAPATVSLARSPGITLIKTGAVTTGDGSVGSTITYSFTARNTGNVTLTGVAIADPHAGLSALAYTWPGATGTLEPNQVVTATATYTIRQSDVDAGAATNTASVTGTPPSGADITASSGQISVPTIAAAPAISTTKSATGGGGGVGSTVSYTFRATNTGNVTLTSVAIVDPLPGLTALAYNWPGTAGTLAPGQSVSATATYTLTQSDVDAGSVSNTSTARGTGGGTTVSANSAAVITPTVAIAPAIAVTKSGVLSGTGAAGDTITYSFTVRNSGNVTLSSVSLVDPLIGNQPIVLTNWPGATGTLAPGAVVNGTATYTVTQSDVDAGSVANTATATGTPPRGASVMGTAPATVPIAAVPSIAVTKSGAVTAGDGGVGSVITFTFALRNSGNVTLTGVTLNDTLAGLSTPVITWPAAANTLAPGQTATGTATYTVRQADVDAGSVRNTATASGRPPTGPVVSATSTQAIVATAAATPALTVTKSAAPASGGRVGDTVTYSIRVENTGNQTVTGITITDPLPGLSALSTTWPGTSGVLAPGQAATARGTYVITQADVNAGSVINTASAAGTAPGGVPVTDASPAVVTPTVAGAPAMTFSKSAALAPGATGRAGDIVEYTFTIRNSGNVTLTGVGVTDPLIGLSPLTYAWPGATGVLQPGQSVIATATRALSQDDVDAGSVANSATANAAPPSGPALELTSSATVPLAPGPALTLAKTGEYTSGDGAVGSIITYSFTATNTGNVTLTGVSVTDGHPGLSPIALTWPGATGTLAPGGVVTGTATYTVEQSDVDAGRVTNTASVTGTPPTGSPIGAGSNTVTLSTVAADGSLATTKSATVTGTGAVGDRIDYTITGTNTGNVTLTAVTIEDPAPGLSALNYVWPGTPGTLLPDEVVTATTSHVITQADVDAGTVANVATTNGTAPNGSPVSASSPSVVTPVVAAQPRLQAAKSGSLPGGSSGAAGETITWTVTLTNTGNVTLTGVSANDSLPGITELVYGTWTSGTVGTLAPGDTVTATATSTVAQSDADAGAVSNTVTASGTPPRGQAATATGSATVPIAPAPAITLTKVASAPSTPQVGDTITYDFTIRNLGNVTLSGVVLTDGLAGLSAPVFTWPGTVGVLAPGGTATATASYVITQADVDSGRVVNSATASATPANGTPITSDPVEVTTPTEAAAPAIETTKSAVMAGDGRVGETISYTVTVRNSGNVTLRGVEVVDDLDGLTDLALSWPQADGVLAPGESVIATATYRIAQADVDRGTIANVADAKGTPPTGDDVEDSDSHLVTLAPEVVDAVFTKDGRLEAGATGEVGDLVEYLFTFTNTGTVTLNQVDLVDDLAGLSAIDVSWPGAANTLAPGERATATATYALTQADIDSGVIDNDAVLTGVPARGAELTRADSASVAIPRTPGLTAVKSGELTNGGIGQVGDIIQYEVVATNTGNVTITGGGLIDPMPRLYDVSIAWPDPAAPGRVGVGESAVGRGKYQLIQEDIDRGYVENTATVGGDVPGGTISADTNTVVVQTVQATGALVVQKSGVAGGNGGVGAPVAYTFVIRNSGNVTVTGISLVDPMPGISAPVIQWPGTAGVLAPGQQATATANYTITQADIDAGAISNTATASGEGARVGTVTSPPASATVQTQSLQASIAVTKTAQLAAGSAGVAGDLVEWSYTLGNTSNVTLTGVTLTDQQAGSTATVYTWPDPARPGVLLPGQTVQATSTYTLTQADVDRGVVSSAVDGTATPPRGAVVTGTATASVVIASRPSIVTTKAGTVNGTGAVGDRIDYAFTISNTGNVTLSLVDLQDALAGVSSPDFVWPGTPGILLPGQVVNATAEYLITQEDVDRGFVTNVATARGKPPVGDLITSTTPPVQTEVAPANPVLEVTKTSDVDGVGAVGDEVAYGFTIENTGNVTVTGIVLTDPLPGLSTPVISWPGDAGVLAPGATATATATYTIVQADVDAGAITNTATAKGVSRAGEVTGASTVVTDTADADPALTVAKSGVLRAGAVGKVGELIDYTFTVHNSGNQTLTAVTLADPLLGSGAITVTWPGEPGVLAVGATATGTATYALTQADVDAGAVVNVVTADATSARGDVTPVTGSATVAVPQAPALSAVKSGALIGDGIGEVGDVIQYEITATNIGNVTITQGRLIDPMVGLYDVTIAWSDTPGVLRVGESVTGRGKYEITQADVDAGFVTNTGTVGGDTPNSGIIMVDTNTVVIATVLPAPALAVTKTGTATGSGGVGDQVEYEFQVENTGNVTLSGVTLTDALAGVTVPVIDWPGTAGVLAPGDVATATATYQITQDDVDAGAVRNVATADGTTPGGLPVSADSPASVVATEAAAPEVAVTNRGALAPGSTGKAGDLVTWTYTLTNTGNVTLDSASFADALPGVGAPSYVWTDTPGVLTPGQSVTATAEYRLTQADVDAGAVSSLVTGSGTPPVGAPAKASAPATVVVPANPGITFQKTGSLDAAGANALGDAVTFDFRVENTGTVTLTGVAITDNLADLGPIDITWPGTPGRLAPGQIATGTAKYVISQDDVDRGQVENTASVRAVPPTGPPLTETSTIVPIPTTQQQPSISTVKTGAYRAGDDGGVGSVVEYSFEITNTGNVTLRLISLLDELAGVSTPELEFPSATGILAPGGVAVGTARYTVTQADVDAGSIRNVATASGTSPSGTVVTGGSDPFVIDTEPQVPAAEAIKTTQVANLATGQTGVLGDTIEYTFTVENTGNTTLDDVTLANTVPGLQGFVYTWPDPANPGRLLPGQAVTVTATHTVTQVDVDAGEVRNTTTGTGSRPRGPQVSDTSVETIVPLVEAVGALSVAKTGTRVGDGSVGSVIGYQFTVTNIGALTLDGVQLTDPLSGLSEITYGAWPGAEERLAPGESVTATASYVITQADVDTGSVRNVATADGTTLGGDDVSADSPASIVPTAPAAPAISLDKTQALEAGATGRPGDTVKYEFTISNDGNVTLRGVTLGDGQPGLSAIRITWPGEPGVLAPGASATGVAEYVLTQADVDAGRIGSTASVSGNGSGTVVRATDDGEVLIAAAPGISLDKTAVLETTAQQGAGIRYVLTVVNTGNVTLRNVNVVDDLAGLSAPDVVWPGTPGVLGAGERAVFTSRYVIGQPDVDRGFIDNSAIATGSAPDGSTYDATDDVTVPVPQTSAIDLTMKIAVADGQTGRAGDTLVFSYAATNTGTTTLTNVVIVDPYPGLSGMTYSWPGEPGVLLPGQTVTATATVTITSAMEGTTVSSRATVTSLDPGGEEVSASASDSIRLLDPIAAGLLPFTGGGNPTGLLGAAGTLLLGGLFLLIAARRRREQQS